MKKVLLAAIGVVMFGGRAFSQNVGIGTNNPQTKLQVEGAISATPAFAAAQAAYTIPNNTSVFYLTAQGGIQANALSMATAPNPGQYLTIYNQDDDVATFAGYTIAATNGVVTLQYISGGWRLTSETHGGTTGWNTSGNAGTVPGTNFIGTTDNQALDIRTNNVIRTQITTTGQIYEKNTGFSTFLGENAGDNNPPIANLPANTFIGYQAGKTVTGVTVGQGAENVYVGANSGNHTVSSTGSQNVGIGNGALGNNTTGGYNTALGYSAGGSSTTAGDNTAIGTFALSDANTGGNTAVGSLAGNHATGSGNVYIGKNAGQNASGDNKLYMANSNTANPLIYGDFANSKVGINSSAGTIGTNPPQSTLDLSGSLGTAIANISSNATLDGTQSTIIATPGITLTLPTIASSTRRIYTIIYNGAPGGSAVTVAGNGAETIVVAGNAGTNTIPLTAGTLVLQNNGTKWYASTQAPSSGSGSYVQNNNVDNLFTSGQGASFDITGNGEISGTLSVGGGGTGVAPSTTAVMDVNGGNASGTNAGKNINLTAQTGGSGGNTNGGDVNITSGQNANAGTAGKVNINSLNSSTGDVNISNGTASQTIGIANNSTGTKNVTIGGTAAASSTIINAGSTGGVKIGTLTNGLVKSTAGVLSNGVTGSDIPTNTPIAGDVTGTLAATTVVKINGTSLSGLGTGILKNTTGTGVPSIAVAGTDYVAPNGAITPGTNTKITYDAKGLVTAGAAAQLASADFANQGTTTTVLHGNAAGNPGFGQVVTGDIANNAADNTKIADMAVNTIKGRITAGTGDPEDLTAAQVKTILGVGGSNSGDVTLAAIGSSPNANGASLSGQVLNLQPADASNGGVVINGTQTFGGNKTFNGAGTFISNAGVMNIQGTDHAYIQWYPDGPGTRKAWTGYGGAADDNFTVANEISGADVILAPTGIGKARISYMTAGVVKSNASGQLTSGTVANSDLANSSITVTAGTGMSGGGAVALGSAVTLTNAGVTSNVAGTGIGVSGATGAVTITNTGVTSAVAGSGISVSSATGAVTITNTGAPATGGTGYIQNTTTQQAGSNFNISSNGIINGALTVGANAAPNGRLEVDVPADKNDNPADNGIYVYNAGNAGDNDDAIIAARVNGASAGDPFISLDIAGVIGWSLGIDNSDGDKFKIGNSWADPSSSTRMTIDGSGNVGIGTTAPSQKLEIIGNVSVPGSSGYCIYDWSGGDANWRIGMHNVDANVGFSRALATSHVQFMSFASGAGQGFAVGDKVSGLSAFEVTGSGSSYNAYFRGNVGIGTASPAAKLDVAGDIRETGYLYVNHSSPSLILQDNDERSAVIHCNSNRLYFLSGSGTNGTSWTINGSYWPLYFDLNSDAAIFGGAATFAEGAVTVSNLAGTGNRAVYADANGVLKTNGKNVAYVVDRALRSYTNANVGIVNISNSTNSLAVETGDIIAINATYKFAFSGGSGGDDVYFRLNITGCATTTQSDQYYNENLDNDRNELQQLSSNYVYVSPCTGNLQFNMQMDHNSFADDGAITGDVVIIATKY